MSAVLPFLRGPNQSREQTRCTTAHCRRQALPVCRQAPETEELHLHVQPALLVRAPPPPNRVTSWEDTSNADVLAPKTQLVALSPVASHGRAGVEGRDRFGGSAGGEGALAPATKTHTAHTRHTDPLPHGRHAPAPGTQRKKAGPSGLPTTRSLRSGGGGQKSRRNVNA
jgi:hypothetical protein